MSSNVVNTVPYLETSRKFPTEIGELCVQLTRSYVDIANTINARTIGIFPVNRPAITGESWFIKKNQRQQTLRQVYTFTTTAPIKHNIDLTAIETITRTFGNYTDGTNWYGLIAGTNVAIAGQISFYIDPTYIQFLIGAGAPPLVKGQIVIEWLSDF